MNVRPLFDRVVIEPVEQEEKTASGIVLLAKDQEKPQMARVIAVGDKVLCSKYAGSEFKIDGKEVTILRQSDILAIVE